MLMPLAIAAIFFKTAMLIQYTEKEAERAGVGR
jgi:hypothetical protein